MFRTALAAGLVALSASLTLAQPTYQVIDLGSLSSPARGQTIPRAIQSAPLTTVAGPMVVGMSPNSAGINRPFLWSTAAGMTDALGSIPGSGQALSINNLGDYVGAFSPAVLSPSAPAVRAFFASTRTPGVTFLPALGGPNLASSASGINDSLTIVGWSHDSESRRRATIWRDQGQIIQSLGAFGGLHSEAFAINNFGQVVGRAQNQYGVYRAFLHDPLSPLPVLIRDLGSLRPNGAAAAYDISNTGYIAGTSDALSPSATTLARSYRRATLWHISSNSMQNLGALSPQHPVSEARGVNTSGHAVGWSGSDLAVATAPSPSTTSIYNRRAFLWDGQAMIDLNSRIPSTSGWLLLAAEDISDAGWIIGWGIQVNSTTPPSSIKGFLLRPQP